ncbi:cytochrome P450 [Paraphoma chrysanthemicola]|nr:cytochrome P450 [Paraphoma chrysanthemicola]
MALLNTFSNLLTKNLVFIWLPLALVLYTFCIVAYRLWFHPLAKYPGPFLAKITGYYTTYFALIGEPTKHRYAALCKYGECVRIGPNELLFGDVASVKQVYGQSSTMPRKDAEFYQGFSLTGPHNVLSVSDKGEHARIRRLLSNAFAFSTVAHFESRLVFLIEKYLAILGQSSQPQDIYDLTQRLYLDTIGELSFDQSFDCLGNGEFAEQALDGERVSIISNLRGRIPFVEWLPLDFIKEAARAQPRLKKFAAMCVDNLRSRIRDGKANDNSLLRRMIEAKNDGSSLSDAELMENAIIFIQAGAGTSLNALVWFIWRVGSEPTVNERLVREIREAFPDPSKFPDLKRVDSLPYLNKVWTEALRLYAPLAVSLPRISPGRVIGGQYVPKGTRIGNLSYYTHRHPDIFPDPETFNPDRWDNSTPDMQLMLRPFSLGPHNCIGMHIARAQLLLTIAGLYQRYDVIVDGSMTEHMLDVEDRGIMFPRKKVFEVKLNKV